MNFQKTNHTLKSGKQITIRLPEEKDAQAILDLKRGYIKNTNTLPLTLDDYPNDLQKEKQLINRYEESENSIFLVAEYNSKLIGNIDLTGSKRFKISHTAMLGMGIDENWRNQGLGRILIKSAIEWAKNQSKLEIIWLDVYASNAIGYNLYLKMGFEISGTIKGFFKQEDTYIDKVQMYQQIK
ncbi:GNAT family N-acetyltransferase [uncultured Kordia sp.]|uniref:GNAT family N-acetyltransferase n=1 Tax=uncultured Kordia sp. TaxID=507699 RepID=UPI00261416F8|nr:GNAT family N-acetyltransferase [uncultured Kordia sp.]